MTTNTFWASYPAEMTDDDRVRLDRPGFKLYVNGYGVSSVFQGDEGAAAFTTYQVVRLTADGPEDARHRIVDALGREPEGLNIVEGKAQT